MNVYQNYSIGSITTQNAEPIPQVLNLWVWGSLRIYISSKFQVKIMLVLQELYFENECFNLSQSEKKSLFFQDSLSLLNMDVKLV